MAERSYNGRNLLASQNGDFENAPPFIAATTTTSRWIDGTAAGSVANDIYKWEFIKDGGTASARFDPTVAFSGSHSIKIDATDASGRARVVFGSNAGTGSSLTASMLAAYAIVVKPNRQYTLSYRVKGTTLAGTGGRISVHEHNSNGVRQKVTQPAGSANGTLDWTLATGTFTTTINTQYLVLSAEQASAGIQTLWFDDISLTEVLPARTTATSRTTATNRVAVRDMGTALRFDGVDDVVVMPGVTRTTFAQTGTYTVAGWFKVNQYPSGGFEKCIWNFQDGGSNRHSFMFDGDGSVGFQRYDGSGYIGKVSSVNKFQTNRYYHYVCINNGGVMSLYINLEEQTTANNKYAAGDSNNSFRVGYMAAINSAFCINGIIDEPRIWNRALTAQEISDLYFNNIVPQDGLVAEYLFDEATGTTAIDTSGNGNDGTITGATYTTDTALRPRTSV